MNQTECQTAAILGQKYAYATVSLVLGIACFVNLLGLEKALLALVFGLLALRSEPAPALHEHRNLARTGIALGGALLVLVPTVLLLNFDRLRHLIEAMIAAAK